MGTVLILGATDLRNHPLLVRECHVNLWILPALLGKRYLLDLGMFIMNDHAARELQGVRLVVPFRSPETMCLVAHMEDRTPESWRVVFGSQPPPPEDARLRATLTRIDIPGLRTHSCWQLTFSRQLAGKREGYVRVRFASYEWPDCLDTFAGWLGLGSRLRLDLRLYDHREHDDFRALTEDLDRRLVPIENSYVYLVAPHVNRPELRSPEFSYIRILEDPLWRRYLQRRPARSRKMHVFAWKQRLTNGQSSSHRIFATLVPRGVSASAVRLISIGSGGFAVAVITLGVVHEVMGIGPPVFKPSLMPVQLAGLVGLIVSAALNLPVILERTWRWRVWLGAAGERIDRWWYGVRD